MKSQLIKKIISKLPDTPGVYFFKKRGKILYVGKATSLRDRVRSYFRGDMMSARGPLIVKMLEDFTTIDFLQTDSVLEALILEAKLIKQHQPDANIKDKDNKSFNYVVITKEDFPRVLVMREKEITHPNPSLTLREGQGRDISGNSLNSNHSQIGMALAKQFGPFTNGSQLREAMKIVRRMFPWRGDKCYPPHPASGRPPYRSCTLFASYSAQSLALGSLIPSSPLGQGREDQKPRACFERQIGLCPGVCTGEISKKDYAKQIKKIILFFEGDKKKLIRTLEKEMKSLAKAREFEKAEKVKRQIFALHHIQDVSLIKASNMSRSVLDTKSFRIESYDIAHLSETNRVGVMTVVENGGVKKSDYRKFKIRSRAPGDTVALTEVLTRRLRHSEWPLPNLIVVDGGVAQKNTAEKILVERNLQIPVVAVVKDEKHRPKEILSTKSQITNDKQISNLEIPNRYKREILLANAEAHRFAISFHRHRRGKLF